MIYFLSGLYGLFLLLVIIKAVSAIRRHRQLLKEYRAIKRKINKD
jgi:heme exporter protein D